MFDNNDIRSVDQRAISSFVTKTFGWMFLAILVTFAVMIGVFSDRNLTVFAMKNFTVIMFVQLGVVLGLSFLSHKVNATVATLLFFLYAGLNGFTFSVFIAFFTMESVLYALGLTILLFGVMSVYGFVTKEDLSKWGGLLRSGLIVLIIASLVNMFLKLPMMYYVISYMGVFIFIALIGYDVNRIKKQAIVQYSGNSELIRKASIFGALTLYLDFINLFIYLLRIFGRRR